MNLLAIDTATDRLSIALASDTDAVNPTGRQNTWLFEADAGLRHCELIMDCIDMLFKTAALTPEDLSGVICMGGPGSFTGLRIGYSTAKGLALSLGIRFAAIPTLDCMAWPFSSLPQIIIPVIDAKKQAFFCALYDKGKSITGPMDAAPEEIARIINEQTGQALLVGPGAPLLYGKLDSSAQTAIILGAAYGATLRWGNAQTLLEMAAATDIFSSNTAAGPEYIRKSDAEIQLTMNKDF